MHIKRVCTVLGILYISIQVFISSCATVSSPTGGPKDTLPPELVKITPPQGALNFNKKVVSLEFNEHIQLKDLQNQLIITPSIEGKYESKQSKNSLELIFEEDFAENTTYTFSFREGIGDLNEGNPAKDLKLAFSTGDYLDSLSINGRIRNLMTDKPVDDALVSLYRAHDTLNVFNSRPYYLAKANKEGYYQFDNLKNGEYLIYAVKDVNKNLKADSRSEPIGFLKDTIALNENIDSLHINILSVNTDSLKINNSRPSGHYYEITMNKGVKSYQLAPIDTTAEPLNSNLVDQSKKVRVYNSGGIQALASDSLAADSLAAFFTATDSLNQQVQDTLYIKFEESRREKQPFSVSIDPKGGSTIGEEYKATISFSKPVKEVNVDSLFIRYDSLTLVRPDTAGHFTWNSQRDKLEITTKLDSEHKATALEKQQALEAESQTKELEAENETVEDTATEENLMPETEKDTVENPGEEPALETPTAPEAGKATVPETGNNTSTKSNKKKGGTDNSDVELYVGKGAFISVENDSSTLQSLKYNFAVPKNFGTIQGTFNTQSKNFTIQLLQAGNLSVAKEVKDQAKFLFRLVKPGEYRIRILVDENGNGHWDPGNIHERIEPEPVILTEEKIVLKANWEIMDIEINE